MIGIGLFHSLFGTMLFTAFSVILFYAEATADPEIPKARRLLLFPHFSPTWNYPQIPLIFISVLLIGPACRVS